ncbi:hypothetical protein EDB81DRAFT_329791 [Dactylonectria macrodidyma]|uniref:Uncharacterized protein n=1 Tax=Dactylonectria macrodidyma TaxID=307937 RepID=A0A9P9FG34_9HYPO|nr:hypothetical protein EDB81DRAFT_329791 [Dactylonectria macrodidyma]
MSGAVSSHGPFCARPVTSALARRQSQSSRGTRPEAAPEAAPERRLRRRGSTRRPSRDSGAATKSGFEGFEGFGGWGLETASWRRLQTWSQRGNTIWVGWLVGGQGRFEARHSKPHPAAPRLEVTETTDGLETTNKTAAETIETWKGGRMQQVGSGEEDRRRGWRPAMCATWETRLFPPPQAAGACRSLVSRRSRRSHPATLVCFSQERNAS